MLKGDEEKEIEKQNLCEKESLNEDAGLSSDFLYVNTFLIETCTSLLNEMKHDISYHFSFTICFIISLIHVQKTITVLRHLRHSSDLLL